MKKLIFLFVFAPLTVFAQPHNHHHLDLELTTQEYMELMKNQPEKSDGLQIIIDSGTRNFEWLKYINQHRDEPLSFSSKATQSGIPITKPKKYSPTILKGQFDEFLAEVPQELKRIMVDGDEFTKEPTTDVKTYLEWARKLNKLYQTSARWRTMVPWLDWLARRRQNDIRGYYWLEREEDLQEKLENFSTLSSEDQARLQEHLLGICYNTLADNQRCADQLKNHKSNNNVTDFYNRYVGKSRELYNSFFAIRNARTDVDWHSGAQVANFPFRDPGTQEVRDFLKVNIEDEWKFDVWQLVVNFEKSARTYIRFVPGATPNVNGLGGDRITMDANRPLTEYNVQWTIRHEFGHVLGFPDCYIEFYDKPNKTMINYQIDVDNLMCSRRGHILQTHYDEMKQNYQKGFKK